MNVTFRQLRLFLALADTGSVSGAAARLHVTQPTASMQLKEVTEAVGLPLYEVLGRQVHLTETGRQLAETARRIAQEWETFGQMVDAQKGLTRGRLRVAVASTAQHFIPRWLGTFCAQHPEIDVSLEILNRDGVLARLRANLDDLYVMSMPPTDLPLEDQIFLANPLVVIAPPKAPWTQNRQLRLADLRTERFILREKGSGTRMAVDRYFTGKGFRPNVRLELGSNEAIQEAVAGGLGLAILSAYALPVSRRRGDVVVLNVEGFPIPSSWHVVYRKGKVLTPVAEVFHRHLLAHNKDRAPLGHANHRRPTAPAHGPRGL